MEDEEIIYIVLLLAFSYILLKKRSSKKYKRRWWVRPINTMRFYQGDFAHLFQELKHDTDMFFRYTRMDEDTFYLLLNKIRPHLEKSNWRALPPEQRLIITLRYLATGDQMTSLALAYRVGISTAHSVVRETCEVIANVLSTEYLTPPTLNEWKNISTGFWKNWNFPNTIGAMDGKHVEIQAPPKSGSAYFNYKKKFSIVLMAMCDHEYKFTVVDIGAFGGDCDAGILSKSLFGKALYSGTLNISHQTRKLPQSDIELPYFVVADEAFQLHKNVMRPYSGRCLPDDKSIFNYRLSRARRVIENTFGILVSRWRIFRRPICAYPSTVDRLVMACVILHNFLMTENAKKSLSEQTYCPTNFIDHEDEMGSITPGTWRNKSSYVENIRPTRAHRATREAYEQRDILSKYLLSPAGKIPWQYEHVQRECNYDLLYE